MKPSPLFLILHIAGNHLTPLWQGSCLFKTQLQALLTQTKATALVRSSPVQGKLDHNNAMWDAGVSNATTAIFDLSARNSSVSLDTNPTPLFPAGSGAPWFFKMPFGFCSLPHLLFMQETWPEMVFLEKRMLIYFFFFLSLAKVSCRGGAAQSCTAWDLVWRNIKWGKKSTSSSHLSWGMLRTNRTSPILRNFHIARKIDPGEQLPPHLE